MNAARHDQQGSDLPSDLASPARRALVAAGYVRLEQLADRPEAKIKHRHGVGPKALEHLRRALNARGLWFSDGAG